MGVERVHGKAASERISEPANHRTEPWKRLGERRGTMRAGLGVEAFFGQAEALDRAAADEVLIDDFGGVFGADVTVPDGLRVDDDGGAVLALVEAAGLVDADARREAGGLGQLLNGGVELSFAVGVAGGARGILGTGVGADKDMAFKRGQAVLLRALHAAAARSSLAEGCRLIRDGPCGYCAEPTHHYLADPQMRGTWGTRP